MPHRKGYVRRADGSCDCLEWIERAARRFEMAHLARLAPLRRSFALRNFAKPGEARTGPVISSPDSQKEGQP